MFKEKEKVLNRLVYTCIFYLSGIIWANRLSVSRTSLPALDYYQSLTLLLAIMLQTGPKHTLFRRALFFLYAYFATVILL